LVAVSFFVGAAGNGRTAAATYLMAFSFIAGTARIGVPSHVQVLRLRDAT
jgi:hypothetical protein